MITGMLVLNTRWRRTQVRLTSAGMSTVLFCELYLREAIDRLSNRLPPLEIGERYFGAASI
ncbi:hypothetical protein BCCGELA001_29610 [Bradyrhizobium sp. CCGE-LA001]|nr:hypothetical protein BCCGELA001_29610 [Bradyrhizobium sp. CCGE-LA001]